MLSGSFDALTDYAIFSILLFNALMTSSIFVFRVRQPDAERPYRTWGYPATPIVFLVVVGYLLVNALITAPVQAFAGIGLILAACRSTGTGRSTQQGATSGPDEAHSLNYRGCWSRAQREDFVGDGQRAIALYRCRRSRNCRAQSVHRRFHVAAISRRVEGAMPLGARRERQRLLERPFDPLDDVLQVRAPRMPAQVFAVQLVHA